MATYRNALPQLRGGFFMTDGGIETTLVFLEGWDLPHFAAFPLLKTAEGSRALRTYFRTYAELAAKFEAGLVLETPTWRANPEWAAKLGYSLEELAAANRQAVALLEDIRAEHQTSLTPIVISGCIGPRGDGYVADRAMSVEQAEDYHRVQIETLADSAADLVTAITMNYVEEAIGIAQAARHARMPAVISFTLETDGHLPTGQPLGAAIEQVDNATDGYASYFMINCAHPTHFDRAVAGGEPWTARIRGLRANASMMSHAELDEAPTLDIGDPIDLAKRYAALRTSALQHLNVMGGCCGTDDRHIERIAAACAPLFVST